jgi:Fe2+ or Zn2+ uptake regulation protein
MSWSATPLRNKIIVALVKRGGEVLDDDLARLVQRGEETVSTEIMDRELMSLEVQGIVNISQITKTRKKIKLINQDRLNPDILRTS